MVHIFLFLRLLLLTVNMYFLPFFSFFFLFHLVFFFHHLLNIFLSKTIPKFQKILENWKRSYKLNLNLENSSFVGKRSQIQD
ncbi:uncharacterized protein ASCRUDRAFT_136479 [Ascoidea rubescens DSM 1968]|uniref:Uncharacterized protein n=1 Tax=Ascoidea rubescens DSM 1968 TaxID=1344418 RepID=A0A1D2VM16_9ASCO|nr:hypothetical protein ASCRUDRAFT_136479 [Ascoidea rubescens DSM 1968]ODV62607.1 hypothetical protein ASCRUDRAFT_136479 [Ascoidea rubescens DSM 1968]